MYVGFGYSHIGQRRRSLGRALAASLGPSAQPFDASQRAKGRHWQCRRPSTSQNFFRKDQGARFAGRRCPAPDVDSFSSLGLLLRSCQHIHALLRSLRPASRLRPSSLFTIYVTRVYANREFFILSTTKRNNHSPEIDHQEICCHCSIAKIRST